MNPLATYFRNLYEIYSTGAGVKETSYYGSLETLLNDVGKTLKPKVRFNSIYPERGAIEIKGTKEDIHKIANSEQVINLHYS
ncbi:hypothetical protein cce_0978 [Crocosphaera subtropica ATCC 51142]|uniref:Uncharacterized protein n=1 Tax=Crocosphaera subtropica (strain ATCC 51142 / BH68) TaxID=43989 RepID=B1WSZ9_CROS5|nr:hypothetical protein [Crocosphaera subtropica]ACB50329.1 hypothetical protein cce_0978 [Crocosphaera subtropica ATCC 51142]